MLGGDKAFNDRLSWALAAPLSALAASAAALAVLALELVLEGDEPGSASAFALPASGLAIGYAGVGAGAKIAPSRKAETAAVLGVVFFAFLLRSARARLKAGGEPGPLWGFVAAGAAGIALAFLRARKASRR